MQKDKKYRSNDEDIEIKCIWEYVDASNAEERLAAAFGIVVVS